MAIVAHNNLALLHYTRYGSHAKVTKAYRPRYTNTPGQAEQRETWGMGIGRWHDMGDTMRARWDTVAAHNRLQMSGFNLHMQTYVRVRKAGEAFSDDPDVYWPTPFE